MKSILVVVATELELGVLPQGVETLVCGIGPVEAGLATARLLAEGTPDALLQVGIAGAHGIDPPALVLGSEAIYCDLANLDASLPRVDRVPADPTLLAAARAALPTAHVRPIGTTARVGGGTGCDVEAMEGFAVLRAAQLAGVPALEVRAISNSPEEPDRSRWRFADALAALEQALPTLVAAVSR